MKTRLGIYCALFLLEGCAVARNWHPLGTGFTWSVAVEARATQTNPVISGTSVFLNSDLYVSTLDGGVPVGNVPVIIFGRTGKETVWTNEKGKLRRTVRPPYPFSIEVVVDGHPKIVTFPEPSVIHIVYDRGWRGGR